MGRLCFSLQRVCQPCERIAEKLLAAVVHLAWDAALDTQFLEVLAKGGRMRGVLRDLARLERRSILQENLRRALGVDLPRKGRRRDALDDGKAVCAVGEPLIKIAVPERMRTIVRVWYPRLHLLRIQRRLGDDWREGSDAVYVVILEREIQRGAGTCAATCETEARDVYIPFSRMVLHEAERGFAGLDEPLLAK